LTGARGPIRHIAPRDLARTIAIAEYPVERGASSDDQAASDITRAATTDMFRREGRDRERDVMQALTALSRLLYQPHQMARMGKHPSHMR
jgi:hypothetical protein